MAWSKRANKVKVEVGEMMSLELTIVRVSGTSSILKGLTQL